MALDSRLVSENCSCSATCKSSVRRAHYKGQRFVSSPLAFPQSFCYSRLEPSVSLTWSDRNSLPDSDPTSQADARKRTTKMSDRVPPMEELASRRRYVPSEIWGDKLDLGKFEDYDLGEMFMSPPSEDQGLCRCCGRHICRRRAILIAIDGACRRNGGPNTRAACSVFGNIGSALNETWVLDDDKPTSQRAELYAAILAFQILQHLCGFIKDRTPPDQS